MGDPANPGVTNTATTPGPRVSGSDSPGWPGRSYGSEVHERSPPAAGASGRAPANVRSHDFFVSTARTSQSRPLQDVYEKDVSGNSTTPQLSAGALAVRAPWPATRPTLAFLQLLLRSANAAFSGRLLLGVVDPADELVAGERGDVLPGIERRGVGDQRPAQVSWKLVHYPTGHSRAAHRVTVAGSPRQARQWERSASCPFGTITGRP